MRRMLLASVGATLAVAVVAAWHWWAGPTVYHLPGADGQYTWLTAVAAPTTGPAARWLVVRQHTDGPFWVLDHQTGRLSGPWPGLPDDGIGAVAVDPAGEVYAVPHVYKASRFAVRRYDFARGTADEVWARADVLSRLVCEAAAGGPAVALAVGGPGRPPRVELRDLFTGAERAALDFPDRVGEIDRLRDGEPAARGWHVSDDGTRLVLGERGWADGPPRPPGLELWDLPAGRLLRTLDPGGRRVNDPAFVHGDRTVSAWTEALTDRGPGASSLDHLLWDVSTGCHLADPTPPLPGAKVVVRDGDRTLWRAPPVPGVERFRVTTVDDQPTADWASVPAGWAGCAGWDGWIGGPVHAQFAPGTTGVVLASDDRTPGAAWMVWLRRRLGIRETERVVGATWYDWRTGRVRRLTDSPLELGAPGVTVQPGRVTVRVSDLSNDRFWLEVWPTPPRPAPPAWLWPVAPLTGGLAVWLVHRRPTWSRAGTASTGSS